MRGGRQPGAGRPLKIKTPQEFEEKAMAIYYECIPDDGPVPTILWLESNLDIDFYRYLENPRFRDIATRVKKKFDALYEQKANKGLLVPHIAKMKMAHMNDYAPVIQEVEVKQETTVNYKLVDAIDARFEAIQDDEDRKTYLENVEAMLLEAKEEEEEET